MFGMGIGELAIIGIIVFIFIGPSKLPRLGESMGQFISNFKSSVK